MPWEALVRKRRGGGALGSLVVEGIWCGQHFFWAGHGMGTPRLQSLNLKKKKKKSTLDFTR